MPPSHEDEIGSLERARERLYAPNAAFQNNRRPLSASSADSVPHAWKEKPLPEISPEHGKRRVRLAGVFFMVAFTFFLVSLAGVAYFFYYGGNSVSVDQITVDIQGPTMIASGDTVPLSLTITNKNPTAIENATIEIAFPSGTRNADDVLSAYPRYIENIGTLASGASVTRSIKAVMFGGTGQSLSLPVSLSYGASGSNAVFVKKSSFAFTISSTPLSVSVESLTETVSGKPFTFSLAIRSNATIPLSDVVLSAAFPFGFSVVSSSLPLTNANIALGTLQPGAQKIVTITGTLSGQDKDVRVFRFTVGTAKTPQDPTLAVSYMTQEATVTIAAPFINTSITVNGNRGDTVVVSPGSLQNVTVSYINTLSTSIANATVAIAISGAAVDYESVNAQSGFYRSSDHTIVFSPDTDSALSTLAPGASGVGAFTFSTLPIEAISSSPTITFSISVSGTRVGQTHVPEQVSSSATKTVKVSTTVVLSAASLHNSGSLGTSGPIPPRPNVATTYNIVWNAQNKGSAVAGGSVTAALPSYVSYTGTTAGAGSFSYDSGSRVVTWSTGELAQGASAQGVFQVSLIPSTSQKGSAPVLVKEASFTGHDRFAGVSVSAGADPVTTETVRDPGYIPENGIVQ
ncbi:MAG: Uncharacterized protein G01um101449_363 [Parcubacteria group bacterium Gr01-1014_49]|nr:MAG: Uncharacterized protein G01um101449_363 [Parcubacteria group bacterium Gr01-1014_49]